MAAGQQGVRWGTRQAPFSSERGGRGMTDVVQMLWGFCHTLRHDGIDYGDYIEQITYLLFLKMADERRIDLTRLEVPGKKGKTEVVDCSWPTLEEQSGTDLTNHYIEILRALGQAH